jgi:hypothetical protein
MASLAARSILSYLLSLGAWADLLSPLFLSKVVSLIATGDAFFLPQSSEWTWQQTCLFSLDRLFTFLPTGILLERRVNLPILPATFATRNLGRLFFFFFFFLLTSAWLNTTVAISSELGATLTSMHFFLSSFPTTYFD